jgi:dTDP-4-dehydrorhamnose reductase
MKIFVTGAGGMVGRAVVNYCRTQGDEVVARDHASLDISDSDQVAAAVTNEKPHAVINCAAWTDVDGCETDRDHAFAANASGPENLAHACREIGATLVTISTDYVFDGRKEGFYTQRDQPAPESIYGLSKLEGERLAQLAHARTTIVRSGFIFGSGGTNFLSTVIQRARRGERLMAIRDAYGTPTYGPDLAIRLRELAELDLPGVFHVVNSGAGVSYEEFARKALDYAGFAETRLESVEVKTLNRPAPRPPNSRLKCILSEAIGLKPLRSWDEALRSFLASESQTEAAGKA